MAREALEEDERGETLLSFDGVAESRVHRTDPTALFRRFDQSTVTPQRQLGYEVARAGCYCIDGTPVSNQELWIGLVEVRPLPHSDLLGDAAGAFTHIVTWASDPSEFRQKSENLANHLGLFVVSVETEELVDRRKRRADLAEALEDLILRAEFNPDAILYGTFHTYRFDEA